MPLCRLSPSHNGRALLPKRGNAAYGKPTAGLPRSSSSTAPSRRTLRSYRIPLTLITSGADSAFIAMLKAPLTGSSSIAGRVCSLAAHVKKLPNYPNVYIGRALRPKRGNAAYGKPTAVLPRCWLRPAPSRRTLRLRPGGWSRARRPSAP